MRSAGTSIFSGITQDMSGLGKKIKGSFSFVASIGNLRQQNEDLITKITELQVDGSKISELEYENNLLKKELGFVGENNKNSFVPAKIIERDPVSFLDYLVIDRGSADGIVEGDPVVFSGVLVGQIKTVMEHTSTVVLITSKDSIVQAMLQNCRAKGILKGGISGLYLENIVRDTEYKEGEYIVTSGLGGKMKQGIIIGRAKALESSSSGIFKTINVEPLIDLSKLELVFVEI